MKCFLSISCSQIAVSLLISIQITVTVCSVQTYERIITSSQLYYLPEYYFEFESNDIHQINISFNKMSTLPENIFNDKNNLLYLYLWSNQLKTLPENIFKTQKRLSQLHLNDNQLTALPENIFKSLNSLYYLDLNDNQLTTLPENIFKSQTNLIGLHLDSNRLTTSPENIFESQYSLKYLYLYGNRLTTLPRNIFERHYSLIQLELHNNSLQTLSRSMLRDISKNSNFNAKTLKLNPNPWFCDCEFLNFFQLYTHRSLDEMVCSDGERVLDKLRRPIILTKNSINSTKYNPKYVNKICGNALMSEIAIICSFKCSCLLPIDNSSISFDCSNQNWTSVPPELGNIVHHFPSVEEFELKIDNNDINSLPDSTTIQGFELITKINATNNSISSISVDNLPGNLKELDLSGNKLEYLPIPVIRHLSKMKTLEKIVLERNAWQCDCNFIKMVQDNINKLDIESIVCADGERVADKLGRPIISMITKKSVPLNEYYEEFVDTTVCLIHPTNKMTELCPSDCIGLFSNNWTSIYFDCSNSNLTNVPAELINIFQQMPSIKEIKLNLNNNNITTLPNSTMHGFNLITKIMAKNNSIKTIGVENIPGNLTEIDLSGNQLESLTTPVIDRLCSLNIKKVDSEQIICNDGDLLHQKHNRRL